MTRWILSPLPYPWTLRADRRGLHDLVAGTQVVAQRWVVGERLSR